MALYLMTPDHRHLLAVSFISTTATILYYHKLSSSAALIDIQGSDLPIYTYSNRFCGRPNMEVRARANSTQGGRREYPALSIGLENISL